MLHTIYDWLELHTFESITKSLDKMIERLHELAARLHAEVVDHRADAFKAIKEADEKADQLLAEAKAKADELAATAQQKETDAAKALATAEKIIALVR